MYLDLGMIIYSYWKTSSD